jgi:hypothetical protein
MMGDVICPTRPRNFCTGVGNVEDVLYRMAPSSFVSKATTNDIPMVAVINALESNRAGLPNPSIAKPLPALRYVNAPMALPRR